MRGVLAFALFAAVLTITPGLDTVLVIGTAAVRGRRPAAAAAPGIRLGVLCWASASALGITALLTASHVAYEVVRWAGVGYLLYLGARALWHTRHPAATEQQPGPEPAKGTLDAFRVGLTTNLLNPKIGVFYLSVL